MHIGRSEVDSFIIIIIIGINGHYYAVPQMMEAAAMCVPMCTCTACSSALVWNVLFFFFLLYLSPFDLWYWSASFSQFCISNAHTFVKQKKNNEAKGKRTSDQAKKKKKQWNFFSVCYILLFWFLIRLAGINHLSVLRSNSLIWKHLCEKTDGRVCNVHAFGRERKKDGAGVDAAVSVRWVLTANQINWNWK